MVSTWPQRGHRKTPTEGKWPFTLLWEPKIIPKNGLKAPARPPKCPTPEVWGVTMKPSHPAMKELADLTLSKFEDKSKAVCP